MKRSILFLAILFSIAMVFYGCGGSSDKNSPALENLKDTFGVSNADENTDTDGDNPAPVAGTEIVQPATLTLSSSVPTDSLLTIGGKATLTAVVTNANGEPIPDGTLVYFFASKGTIAPFGTTQAGKAAVTYKAEDEEGTVVITAYVKSWGEFAHPVGDLDGDGVDDAAVQGGALVEIGVPSGDAALLFVSAVEPQQIGIRGGGKAETSLVTFRVADAYGNPAPDGTAVAFALLAPFGGGERLLPATATTEDGFVVASLQSGTVAGVATITATLTTKQGEKVSTEAKVSILAGLPDQKHFGIAAEKINVAGYAEFGIANNITAFLGDRYSNPVAVGTPVHFSSEAGIMVLKQLPFQDLNGNGIYDVLPSPEPPLSFVDLNGDGIWQKGEPPSYFTDLNGDGIYDLSQPETLVPTNLVDVNSQARAVLQTAEPLPDTTSFVTGLPGLSTIIAYTEGQESFVDINGNGSYDASDTFDDIGEPFIDSNDNGLYDAATEHYVDANDNGRYDGPNGVWDGDTVIWTAMRVLFTDDNVLADIVPSATVDIANGASADYVLTVTDGHFNPLLPGTTISFEEKPQIVYTYNADGSIADTKDVFILAMSDERMALAKRLYPGLDATIFNFSIANISPLDEDRYAQVTVTFDTGRVVKTKNIVVLARGTAAP